MTSTDRTVPTRWRLLVPAALLAAAATLGGSAFGDPAVAFAAPREWDIGEYDKCIQQADHDFFDGKISVAVHDERVRICCSDSGGVWKAGLPLYDACTAPPANAAGRTVPPGVITHTLTPAPATAPPGDITQTFTPAP
jgi:hypothetical protein